MDAWEVGHTWSLSVEEHSYLIWPLLVRYYGRMAFLPALACILAAPFARLIWPSEGHPVFAGSFFATPCRIDSIAIGAILAFLATSDRLRRLLPNSRWISTACIVVAFAGLSANRYALVKHWPGATILYHSVNSLLIALILWVGVYHHDSWLFRWLSFRPMVFIGLLSYSLYLWQNPFFNPHADHWWTRWPTNCCLLVSLALGSYFLVERPFLRLKGRLVG